MSLQSRRAGYDVTRTLAFKCTRTATVRMGRNSRASSRCQSLSHLAQQQASCPSQIYRCCASWSSSASQSSKAPHRELRQVAQCPLAKLVVEASHEVLTLLKVAAPVITNRSMTVRYALMTNYLVAAMLYWPPVSVARKLTFADVVGKYILAYSALRGS